ncbi:hypothetical protein KCU98_g17033, partial [Aureobasidium melanogenum]
MKSIVIAAAITTLVAAVPPPPVSSDQPATGLAIAASDKGPCYKQCRNHCLKVYSVLLASPISAPFFIWRCTHKCKKECSYENDDGDSEDAILDLVNANGTIEVDVEKLKEALDMDMVD